jgi:hypothetical protein
MPDHQSPPSSRQPPASMSWLLVVDHASAWAAGKVPRSFSQAGHLMMTLSLVTGSVGGACGNRPADARELQLHRKGLETVWLVPDPDRPGQVAERWHCERCQPHRAAIIMCGLCSSTVMLGGNPAGPDGSPLPDPAAQWLAVHDWKQRHGAAGSATVTLAGPRPGLMILSPTDRS